MRGFTMVLFLGTAIALPISESSSGASKTGSPQDLEHRAIEAVTTPLNSWTVMSIAKRVAVSFLPRSPFTCYQEKRGCPHHLWGVKSTNGSVTDNGEGTKTTPPDTILERLHGLRAQFWAPWKVDSTKQASNNASTADVKNLEKGTAKISQLSHVQARSPQAPAFWGPAHVDDTPANAEKDTATISEIPHIQGRSTGAGPSFWGPAHVDDTPADALKGIGSSTNIPRIQERSPQAPKFWGPAHVDDTPSEAESHTPEVHGRSTGAAPSFWGPAHVDDTPSDAEDSAESVDKHDATADNGQKNA